MADWRPIPVADCLMMKYIPEREVKSQQVSGYFSIVVLKMHVGIDRRGQDNFAKSEKKICSILCRESVSVRGHSRRHQFKLGTVDNSQGRGLRPQSQYFKVSNFICH